MKAGWEVKTLGEICKFVRGPFGGSLKKDIFVQDGYAVYEQQHAIYNQFNEIRYFIEQKKFEEMSRFELRANDLIMSCSGTMGKVAIVPAGIKQGIINQALLKLSPSNLLLPKFLKYWMESDSFQDGLKEQSGGAAIQNVASVAILKEIKITLPVLTEQQRIVSILDQAFEGIAKARANAEQNLQNARALFESHLQSVFTQRGEGWVEKIFDEVLEIKNGRDQKPVEKAGGKYPIYGSAGNVMGWTDAYICDEQTTIIGRKGTINRPIFIETKFWNVDTAFGLAAKPNLNPKFLYYFCLSYDFSLHNRGTTIPSLVKTDLLNIKISVPSLAEQERFVEKFLDLHKETQRLETLYQRKITCLDELKKSLLQQAFAGEL